MRNHEYNGVVWSAPAQPLYETLEPLLEAAGLIAALSEHYRVIIKPNLVEALEPPITTPVAAARETSASSSTIKGALPPSSRHNTVMFRAAAA